MLASDNNVTVIIPAYNEQEYIHDTVRSIWSIPEIRDILVVDDGSTDRTADLARRAGARVLSLCRNRGKGEALNEAVRTVSGPVALLDADLGETAKEARLLIIPILEKKADMTIARFPQRGGKAGFGLVKTLAKKGIKFYTGLETEAPLSGQRAMTEKVLRGVTPFASGFGVEVTLTIEACRRGYRILEVPVDMRHNESLRNFNGFMHRGRQFWHVAKAFWKMA